MVIAEHSSKGASNLETFKVSFLAVGVGLALVVALILFVSLHLVEARQFVRLWNEAEPRWLFISIFIQIPTYLAAGAVWFLATPKKLRAFGLKTYSLLSLEQLSIDQLVPAAGLAGHSIVLKSLARLGIPLAVSMEVVMTDILGYHAAYSTMTLAALFLLSFYNGVTPIIIAIVSAYFAISISVTVVLLLLVFKKIRKLPEWFAKRGLVKKMYEALNYISPERVLSGALLAKAMFLRASIFLLDILTLWAVMRAIGAPVDFTTAFAALVIASIAATVSFMPGGLGGFEIGSVAMLVLFGVSTEAALAGTLLFRGLAFWIPFVPGLILLRREFNFRFR